MELVEWIGVCTALRFLNSIKGSHFITVLPIVLRIIIAKVARMALKPSTAYQSHLY